MTETVEAFAGPTERPDRCPYCGHWDTASRFTYGPGLFTCMACGVVFRWRQEGADDEPND
jgi:ribosomal protein L37AE/L43A